MKDKPIFEAKKKSSQLKVIRFFMTNNLNLAYLVSLLHCNEKPMPIISDLNAVI